ncbi:hypothetical protein WR25_00183 [Diploscapter pachys]|uniref:Uncharacterized protein n=1 Tax=Diploscapter pachys TaxID=2018661 RepID=A0A2A2M5D8_9BILA|nr:hypothetical protein WR25_00183 [Diploscapter pachys]
MGQAIAPGVELGIAHRRRLGAIGQDQRQRLAAARGLGFEQALHRLPRRHIGHRAQQRLAFGLDQHRQLAQALARIVAHRAQQVKAANTCSPSSRVSSIRSLVAACWRRLPASCSALR